MRMSRLLCLVGVAVVCVPLWACASRGIGWTGRDGGRDGEAAVADSQPALPEAEEPCGNGRVDPGEECDGRDVGGKTCLDLSSDFVGGVIACRQDCTFDTSGCVRWGCGNGHLDFGEACDDGNLDTGDGCGVDCQVEPGWTCTGQPSRCERLCGNGWIDPGEDCEGDNLGGASCASLGFTDGILRCDSDCRYDTSGCTT